MRPRDADAVEDVEFRFPERRRQLVLHHLHACTRPDDLLPILHRADAPDVEPHRRIELERVPTSRGLRRTEHDADLHPHLVDEDDDRSVAADDGGQLPQRLRHEARLEPEVRVAHLALDLRARHESRDRVDDDQVDGRAPDERLGDLQRLLAGIRL